MSIGSGQFGSSRFPRSFRLHSYSYARENDRENLLDQNWPELDGHYPDRPLAELNANERRRAGA